LDNNVPTGLAALLSPHDVVHASHVGWAALNNGDLITAADGHGYSVMITGDRSIRYQQNLRNHICSLIELTTTHWPTIRGNYAQILSAIETIKHGSYTTIGNDILDAPPAKLWLKTLDDTRYSEFPAY
jgi:hypothetical protein